MRTFYSLLLALAVAIPSTAMASDGRKLIMAFMDICVLNSASPVAVEETARTLGMKEVSTSPYPFADLGNRYSDAKIFSANDPASPYVV